MTKLDYSTWRVLAIVIFVHGWQGFSFAEDVKAGSAAVGTSTSSSSSSSSSSGTSSKTGPIAQPSTTVQNMINVLTANEERRQAREHQAEMERPA